MECWNRVWSCGPVLLNYCDREEEEEDEEENEDEFDFEYFNETDGE